MEKGEWACLDSRRFRVIGGWWSAQVRCCTGRQQSLILVRLCGIVLGRIHRAVMSSAHDLYGPFRTTLFIPSNIPPTRALSQLFPYYHNLRSCGGVGEGGKKQRSTEAIAQVLQMRALTGPVHDAIFP